MDKDIVPEWRNDTYIVIYFMQLSVVSTSTTSSPLPHPDPDRPLDWSGMKSKPYHVIIVHSRARFGKLRRLELPSWSRM